PTSTCPKTLFQGPHNGWIVGGQPVIFDGFAMRTQTEVLATRGGNPVWVGVDALNFNDPQGGLRQIRWRTSMPGAVAGVIQVSTDRFPVGPNAQQQQTSLLASWNVPLAQQGGWSTLPPIDFASFARPTCDPQQFPNGCPLQPPCDPQSPNGCTAQRTLAGAIQNLLRQGAPIHVRVVAIDRAGGPLGDTRDLGITSYVRMANVPPRLSDVVTPPPPQP